MHITFRLSSGRLREDLSRRLRTDSNLFFMSLWTLSHSDPITTNTTGILSTARTNRSAHTPTCRHVTNTLTPHTPTDHTFFGGDGSEELLQNLITGHSEQLHQQHVGSFVVSCSLLQISHGSKLVVSLNNLEWKKGRGKGRGDT